MNMDVFRQRVELRGELSKVEAKDAELALLLGQEYFAEVRVEGRTLRGEGEDEGFVCRVRESRVCLISQGLFSGPTFGLWNDLSRRYILDMRALLAIRRLELMDQIDALG